jgi:hypothetical protein
MHSGHTSIAIGATDSYAAQVSQNRRFYRGNRLPPEERYRQFYLSLDIDWAKIPTHSRFLRSVFEGLNYIKFPLPGLEYNTKGEFKRHWVAF